MLAVLENEPAAAVAAIKLFGTTITLPPDVAANDPRSSSAHNLVLDLDANSEGELISGNKFSEQERAENNQDAGASDLEDLKTPSYPVKNFESRTGANGRDQNDTNESCTDRKVAKRPDREIPCPRCDSNNTKFCYYNNYNMNQPRHFCRGCQRYWTAGGTMRNVPVGSGRRKSKSSTSPSLQCCPSVVFDASRIPDSRNCGTILSFGSGFPILNLVEKAKDCLQNGIQSRRIDTGNDCSSVSSSVTALSSSSEKIMGNKGFMEQKDNQGFVSQVPSFQASQLGFPVSLYRAASDRGCINLTLGKGSRDGRTTDPSLSNMCASWREIRMKDEKDTKKGSAENSGFMNSKGPFRGLQRTATGIAHTPEMSLVLQANPAALSRSLNFHESC